MLRMITKDPRGVGSAPPLHCTLGRMRVWRHASRTVRLLRGDIAHSDTDAIAVSSNPFLMGTLRSNFARFSGRTNADGAVRALGGASLLAATSRLRGSSGRLPLSPGSAVVSEAGSELRARWVVHCVAPDSSSRGPSCWHGSEQGDHALEQLRDDIVSQRALAQRHGEPELFLALHCLEERERSYERNRAKARLAAQGLEAEAAAADCALQATFSAALAAAGSVGATSLALPAIGCGVKGFDAQEAGAAAFSVAATWLRMGDGRSSIESSADDVSPLRRLDFVVWSDDVWDCWPANAMSQLGPVARA